jgi:oligopeptide transport system ATP-binding protein
VSKTGNTVAHPTTGGDLRASRAGRSAVPGQKLLEVRDLSTQFVTRSGVVHAVDGVSFELDAGETLGLVGESGCGKSMTALSILRLVPEPHGRITAGEIVFDGEDLLQLEEAEMRRLRGGRIGMIFQDPMTSLNPVHTVGDQIAESARIHLGLSRRLAQRRAVELLASVGIPRARDRADDYPHQFSGGMRQRVMIAIALACDPVLLLADEPTTALDVTIQAQILELIRSLSAERGMAVVLITHDLGIAAGMCDRVNVMYAGRIVETGPIEAMFDGPRMPYTWGLMDSIPGLNAESGAELRSIEGLPPDLIDPEQHCRFAPRCRYARDICRTAEPALSPRNGGEHLARCWGTEPGGWLA